jgi:tetratricopeptide (TPR) repeat protein
MHADYLVELQQGMPAAQAASVISSLRQDPILWGSLENDAFCQMMLAAPEQNYVQWSPANLALVACGCELSPKDLGAHPMVSLPETIQHNVRQIMEETLKNGNIARSLVTAAWLALGLRERRRLTGSWQGLSEELLSKVYGENGKDIQVWRTPLACLYSLVPDSENLLIALVEHSQFDKAMDWVTHIILTNPMDEVDRIGLFSLVFSKISLAQQVAWLKALKTGGQAQLVTLLVQFISGDQPHFLDAKKTPGVQGEPGNDFDEMLNLQLGATLSQLSGDPARALELLKALKVSLRYWLTGLEVEMADIASLRGETTGNFHELQTVLNTVPDFDDLDHEIILSTFGLEAQSKGVVASDSSISKNPFITMKAAEMQAATGEMDIARAIARQAVDQLEKQAPDWDDLYYPKFILSWDPTSFVRTLLEFGLISEALRCALEILTLRPADEKLINQISRIYNRAGDKSNALKFAHLAVALQPENLDYHRHLATLWESLANWRKSVLERRKVVNLAEGPAPADWYALAEDASKLEKPDMVVEACWKVIEFDPNHGKAHALIGKTLMEQGDLEGAAEHLKQAVTHNPEIPLHWLLMAKLHRGKGNLQDALNTLRAAILAVPESAEVYLNLSKLCFEMGLFAEGVPLLKKAKTLESTSPNVALELSESLLSLDYLEDGRFVLEVAREKWQQDANIAHAYAKVLISTGNIRDAVPALEDAIRYGQPNADRLVLYADTLLRSYGSVSIDAESLGKARQALAEALKLDPENFLGRLLMAEVLAGNGENEEAYQIYQLLVESREGQSEKWHCRVQKGFGKLALALGQIETALAALQDVALSMPDDLDLQQLLAEAFYQADLKQEALQVARFALKLAPDDLRNISWFMDMMVRLDRFDEAITALETATDLAPDYPDYWIRMAELQSRTGDLMGVHHTLSMLLTLDRLSVDHLQRAAKTFLQLGEFEPALTCMEKAVALSKGPQPLLLFDLAALYQNGGKSDLALETIRKAGELENDNSYIHTFQADILALLGQYPLALDSLDQARHYFFLEETNPQDRQWYGEFVKILCGSWLESIHSPAGLEIRYAYLMQQLGNSQVALQHVEKALETSSDDYFIQLMACNLAKDLLEDNRHEEILARTYLENLTETEFKQDSPNNKRSVLQLLAIKAEEALKKNKENQVQILLSIGLSLNAEEPRLMAAQARLFARQGDWPHANALYHKLTSKPEAVDKKLPDKADRLPDLYLEREFKHAEKMWLADVSREIRRWDDSIRLSEEYCSENPAQPGGWLDLARTIVLAAEEQRQCDMLKCVAHAPGQDKLGEEYFEKFNQAITHAAELSSSPEVGFWRVRGHAAFHLNAQNVRALAGLSITAEVMAVLVAALRKVNLTTTAIQMAVKYPDDASVLLQTGLCYLENDPTKGVNASQHGVELKPNDPLQHVALALLAQADGQIGLALQSIETALIIWPDEPEWHAWIAGLASSSNDISLAVNHWQQAVALAPDCPDYAVALGGAYLISSAYSKAIEILEKASRLSPDREDAWLYLAQAYRQTGRVKEAIESADRAGTLDPKSPLPLLLCGEIALDMKNIDLAYEYAQEGFRRNSQDEKTVLFMSKVLVKQGRLVESLSVLEQSLASLNSSLPVLLERAKLTRTVRGINTALPMFCELSEMFPENVEVLKWLVKTDIEVGDYRAAENAAREALRIAPSEPDINFLMGQMQRRAGQLDQAIHYLSEAIRQSPSQIDPYLELGKAYEERREYLMALRIYQQAIKVAPKDYRPYYLAGLMLKESKDYGGAESMLRRAAELAPEEINIRKVLGVVITLNLVHNSLEAKVTV